MAIETDKNGRPYFNFKNVRVTLINEASPDKDWADTGRYLQILSYRDNTRTTTHSGPRIPINDVNASDEKILRGFEAMLPILTGEPDKHAVVYWDISSESGRNA